MLLVFNFFEKAYDVNPLPPPNAEPVVGEVAVFVAEANGDFVAWPNADPPPNADPDAADAKGEVVEPNADPPPPNALVPPKDVFCVGVAEPKAVGLFPNLKKQLIFYILLLSLR
uniref:Uncharacterized protein n=1 Tax=Panagrolaimus davidi TaxID=227884 RepID=A0A914QI55_9BILA